MSLDPAIIKTMSLLLKSAAHVGILFSTADRVAPGYVRHWIKYCGRSCCRISPKPRVMLSPHTNSLGDTGFDGSMIGSDVMTFMGEGMMKADDVDGLG